MRPSIFNAEINEDNSFKNADFDENSFRRKERERRYPSTIANKYNEMFFKPTRIEFHNKHMELSQPIHNNVQQSKYLFRLFAEKSTFIYKELKNNE